MKNFLSIIIFCFITLFPLASYPVEIELKPCVEISHCVIEEWDVSNIIEPVSEVKKIIINTSRTEIVEADGNYIHAEVTSRIMKYIDDLELNYIPEKKTLIVRSESRVGEGDFGVNQKRIDRLKVELLNKNA